VVGGLLKNGVVILRSAATKNLLSYAVDPREKQILRYTQDDKKINTVRTLSTVC